MLLRSLKALAAYSAIFDRDGISWGHWISPDHPQVMPYFVEGEEAAKFIEDAYEHGWVMKNFPWSEWIGGEEATRLRNEPGAIEGASADQLGKLLTSGIRADRFREGTLEEAFKAGLVTRIVRRAKVLASA